MKKTGLADKYMTRALALALKGEGRVEPNPLVGAVIVKNNRIIGEGYHQYFGGPHAEVNALCSTRASVKNSTLYITLEPCAHHGKTPPCVDAIIQAGIKKVVLACREPNPITAGRGIKRLKTAGIKVTEGMFREKAQQINAPFFKLHRKGLPYVVAKWAMSMDGKIATRSGNAKWISSALSRDWAHQYRSRFAAPGGAIMVGIETILKDDSLLLVSLNAVRNPQRIILDAYARLPLKSRIIKTLSRAGIYVVVAPDALRTRVHKLAASGCQILEVATRRGYINLSNLSRQLAKRGINKILVEGGGEVLASAFKAGLVDEVLIFIAPKIIGGRNTKTPVEGEGITDLKKAWLLKDISVATIGPDILVKARVNR